MSINSTVMIFHTEADLQKAVKTLYDADNYEFCVGLDLEQAVDVLIDVRANPNEQWQASSMNC